MKQRTYLCIDLKSFYASVECVERRLDPMTTRLVVADPECSDKTICLAITPAMKELGIKNRCRIFEIPKTVSYITAPPRMQKYIEYSAEVYAIYLKYISKDDIHVYSIDEAFMDARMHLIEKGMIITVTYYKNEECLQKTGMVARLDTQCRILQVVDTKIMFEDILDVNILR